MSGGDGLVAEMDLIDVAHITHLAGEQLDQQVTDAQGQNIGRQVGIDPAIAAVQFGQSCLDNFRPAMGFADDMGPGYFGP